MVRREMSVSASTCAESQSLREGTYSEKPFHFSRYSTCPLTTRLSSTFSTTYSSSSSEEELSAVRLVFFPMSHAAPPEGLRPPVPANGKDKNGQNPCKQLKLCLFWMGCRGYNTKLPCTFFLHLKASYR